MIERAGGMTVEAKRGSASNFRMGEPGKSVMFLRALMEIFMFGSKPGNCADAMGCSPHRDFCGLTRQEIPIKLNDLERYLGRCQVCYRAVQRASCQGVLAESAVGDEIPAWAGPVAHAPAAGAVPAVAGEFLAWPGSLVVGVRAVVAEGLLAGPGAEDERSSPVAN